MQQEASGELVITGQNDLLAMALGKPEHPGRVRGVGQDATISGYFRREKSSSKESGDDDAAEEARRQMEERIKAEMMINMKAMASSFGAKIQALEDIIKQLIGNQNNKGSPVVELHEEEVGTRTPIPKDPYLGSGKASCSIHKSNVSTSAEEVSTKI